ncbi:MAG: LytTr DNA-binding domain [Bacteroidetes bacterium]|nr:LytTr DNA-binding domain [Bacteroidota bacterium]
MKINKVQPLSKALFINSKRRTLSLPYNEITVAACDKPYIRIESISGKRFHIEMTLKDFVAILPPCFAQFDRSRIVNLCHVSEIHNTNKGCELLINDIPMRISKRRKALVQDLFLRIKRETGGETNCSTGCSLC